MKSKYIANRNARTLRNWISLAFAPVLLAACASAPTVLTEYETVRVEVPVRIPVPENLLTQPAPCEFPPGDRLYIFDVDEWISCAVDALGLYYRQLERIKELQTEPLPE